MFQTSIFCVPAVDFPGCKFGFVFFSPRLFFQDFGTFYPLESELGRFLNGDLGGLLKGDRVRSFRDTHDFPVKSPPT